MRTGDFVKADPFPHLVFDLDTRISANVLRTVLEQWPQEGWKKYQNGKRAIAEPLPESARQLMSVMHKSGLEQVTGIPGLIRGHGIAGGGLTEVMPGGSLGIHVDFNRLGELYRRLNVILYLNPEWEWEWGGQLELWKSPKDGCSRRINPIMNRLVIFESSERSWHGHPRPIKGPVSRKAMAWYYYTKEPGPGYREQHSTVYID